VSAAAPANRLRRGRLPRVFVSLFGAAFAAHATAAPTNLGFERAADAASLPPGWELAAVEDGTAAAIALDSSVTAEGRRSLRVERRASGGATRLAQRLPAADFGVPTTGRRLRWSGAIRAAPGTAASLWLRLGGGAGLLYLDSRGDGQEPDGTVEVTPTATAVGVTAWRRYTLELPLPSDAEEVAVGVALRGSGVAHFDALALEVIDGAALAPAAPAARRYVEAALTLMREHSLRTALIDWGALRTAALEFAHGAVAPADAHSAVRFAVRALGDRHSYLQSPRATDELRVAPVANARTRQALVAPSAELLAGRIGYLVVPGFAGGAAGQQVEFAESIKNLIQATDVPDNCGWVLDLRRNAGGNLWPMLAGVGPLLGEGDVAASVYPDGRRTPVWYRDGQAGFGDYTQLRVNGAYRLRSTLPPVAVLTSGATASSGEVLVLAFTGRPQARTFGTPTRGLSAGNRTFPLADGAALVLTVAGTADRLGRVPLGPLPPDELVVAAGRGVEPSAGTADPVVAAALAWLGDHAGCS